MRQSSFIGARKSEPVGPAARASAHSISFLDLKAQYATIRHEVLEAVGRVLESQEFILGMEVELFEEAMALFVGVPEAVGCASGSDALYLALRALGVGQGDEVITSPFTFVATADAIARTGAVPVFVDIHPETFNLDPARIEPAITEKTRAILPVHLFGLAAEMNRILAIAREHNLAVIEDAAQSIGSTYRGAAVGSLGSLGCFSFFPSNNLGGAGDGGMVTTHDPELADRIRLLRSHGSRRKHEFEVVGLNSRLDAIQAAILRVKLRYLREWEQQRARNAARYHELFRDNGLEGQIVLPVTPPNCTHVFNQYVIRCRNRSSLRAFLSESGIPTDVYYPTPLHLQPAFSYLGQRRGSLPAAEAASSEVLALP
ncbi:MAG: DegT/DnrJ/EryC1/StrS family aminotransferase, partial [Candidatus Acidiferrales bacterium]